MARSSNLFGAVALLAGALSMPVHADESQSSKSMKRVTLGLGFNTIIKDPSFNSATANATLNQGGKFGFKVQYDQTLTEISTGGQHPVYVYGGVKAFGSWAPNEVIASAVNSPVTGETHNWGLGGVLGMETHVADDTYARVQAGAGASHQELNVFQNGALIYTGDSLVPTVYGGVSLDHYFWDCFFLGLFGDLYWSGGFDVKNQATNQTISVGGRVEAVVGVQGGIDFSKM